MQELFEKCLGRQDTPEMHVPRNQGIYRKKKGNLRSNLFSSFLVTKLRCNNSVRRRRTLPNFVGLLWTLAKALRVFWAIGRAVMTSQSRCAKDSALVRHKILSSSPTSGEHRVLAHVLLKNFVAAAFFSVSYFLNVVKEFRSCVLTNFLQCFLYDFS